MTPTHLCMPGLSQSSRSPRDAQQVWVQLALILGLAAPGLQESIRPVTLHRDSEASWHGPCPQGGLEQEVGSCTPGELRIRDDCESLRTQKTEWPAPGERQGT